MRNSLTGVRKRFSRVFARGAALMPGRRRRPLPDWAADRIPRARTLTKE